MWFYVLVRKQEAVACERRAVWREQKEWEEKQKKTWRGYHGDIKPSLAKYFGDVNSCLYDPEDQI